VTLEVDGVELLACETQEEGGTQILRIEVFKDFEMEFSGESKEGRWEGRWRSCKLVRLTSSKLKWAITGSHTYNGHFCLKLDDVVDFWHCGGRQLKVQVDLN
jgi:hypothetical protein